MFKQVRLDYKRHGSSVLNPALWAVLNYRLGVWSLNVRFVPLRWLTSKVYGLNMFFILEVR